MISIKNELSTPLKIIFVLSSLFFLGFMIIYLIGPMNEKNKRIGIIKSLGIPEKETYIHLLIDFAWKFAIVLLAAVIISKGICIEVNRYFVEKIDDQDMIFFRTDNQAFSIYLIFTIALIGALGCIHAHRLATRKTIDQLLNR